VNRKKFLSTLLPLATALPPLALKQNKIIDFGSSMIPLYLKKGDSIGICSAAGFINVADCADAINTMQAWGYKIKIGTNIGKKYFGFGGTDEERLQDLQNMLDDESLQAIMIARGGYGIVRIIDKLNFKKFSKKPKWIIGFSDATVLHSHIHKNFGIATLHSKMCNSFVNPLFAEQIQIETIYSIKRCLSGEKMVYNFASNANNKIGNARGVLVGGNLKTLETLSGSVSDINTNNKILFVEDTGEYLYSIDRMFYNLKRSGKLNKLAALIVGGFKFRKDDVGEEFGKSLEEIVLEKVKEFNYPVCFDFPVGHQKNNVALKCGVTHSLKINSNGCSLIADI
jgi:muramoyltetrapeptide carboxypeptidase